MAKSKRSSYALGKPLQRYQPFPIEALRAPAVTDVKYDIGQTWVRTDTNQAWTLTSVTAGSATWAISSPGASDVDTLTGDGGGAISPVAGNIDLLGGTNITTAGTAGTVTYNLDDAIVLATSATSPLYTSAAAMAITSVGALTVTSGGATAITTALASNITVTLGDAGGTNAIIFVDSAAAERARIDSDGTLTVVNMDGIIGATTPAAIIGTTIVANTSVTSPIYTSVGAVDTNINAVAGQDIHLLMGDNAGANIVSFRDSDDAEVATIDSNGAFTTTGLTFTGLLTANASALINTAGAALDLATDNTAGAVNIGHGTTIRAINIGTVGGVAHTVSIGSATAGAIAVDTAAGISLDAVTASNFTVTGAGVDLSLQGVGGAVNMTSTQTENDAIYIEASAANGGVQILAGTGGIMIGDEADCTGITVGNAAPGATRNVVVGGGTVVTAAVTDTISIAGGGATTNANSIKTLNLNTGTVAIGEVLTNIASGTVTSGTHTTSIATGNRAAGTMALNMLTGTGTKTMSVGNADGLTTVNIDGITLINDSINVATSINTGTSTGACTIGNLGNGGTVTVDSAALVEMNVAGGGTFYIGNDASAQTIAIGNTNTTTALILQAGTGDITMNGTIKEVNAEFIQASGTDIIVTQSPILQSNADTGVDPTGATGNVNLMHMQDGCLMEQFILGAGQTIICPRMTANGLNIALDLVDNEGAEYNFGARSNAKHVYTVGASLAFFIEAEIYVADMSGCEPLWIGFRKVQANDADYTNWTDFYVLGLNNATSATNVTVGGRLNSGGITLQDTTDAWGGDTTTCVLRINVSAGGVITATIDGVAASAPLAQTFDADEVMPFIHFLHDTTIPGEISLVSFKCGYQA